MFSEVVGRVQSSFLAGILVIIPIGVTSWILVSLVSFLENGIHLLPSVIRPSGSAPGLGVVVAISTVLLLGFSTQSYMGGRLLLIYENMLSKIPIMSGIYQGIKQLTETLFSKDKNQFQRVVMVEWPRRGVYAIAFYTGEAFLQPQSGARFVNIFLPTTPNPTSGFYLVLPEDELHDLDLTVEEAFKIIMSAGIVAPASQHVLNREVLRAAAP